MLKTNRRVILSGTPIQNDLSEFFAMVDYVNPGILGSVKQFKNVYEEPIMRSREVDATPEAKALGQQRSLEVSDPDTLIPTAHPKNGTLHFKKNTSVEPTVFTTQSGIRRVL